MPKPKALIGPGTQEMLHQDVGLAQRQAFLAAYETRRRADSIFSLARQLVIPRPVVIRWLQDPTFQQALMAADSWRITVVRDVFAREMQAIAENMAEIAKERWPHSVRIGQAIIDFQLGTKNGEHRLRAISVEQLNVFGSQPTEDKLTELLARKRKHDRILARYLKGVEAPAEVIGPQGTSGRPKARRGRVARGPGPIPDGDPPPGA